MGEQSDGNELYRIAFDGTIFHERAFVAIGGRSEALLAALQDGAGDELLAVKPALEHCLKALKTVTEQDVAPDGLEVALLDRNRPGRKFRRLSLDEFSSLLS